MKLTLPALCALALLAACNNDPAPPASPAVPAPAVSTKPVPAFNADSAYAFVKQQVDFGPRVPGSKGHQVCGDWLVKKLKEYGADVIEQTGTVRAWNGQPVPLRNIIGRWRPEATERVLLLAHWDTRPYADKDSERVHDPIDGANDGASGVGVLLELARHLATHDGKTGFDVFFTDVEDMGEPNGVMGADDASAMKSWCLGSQYWVKNPHVAGYTAKYGILLDMVGARGSIFPKESWSMRYASHVVDRVWRKAAELGHSDLFVNEVRNFVGIDDHVVVNQGTNIPTIDIIGYSRTTGFFPATWHTHDDNMEDIDATVLGAVGNTVLHVVWTEK